jgi:biotin-[acetyl-CoA-carboxylase] ligase BirA-like protein
MLNVGQVTSEWAANNKVICWFEPETTSTNDIAKKSGFIDEPSWMFVTNNQTQGRGRHDNTWSNSQNNDQLLLSWCFRLKSAPQPIASPLFGWAVYKSLNDEFDLSLNIKAPNDIYINSKKVGGILLESVSQGSSHYICAGLGLNVNSSPKDVPIATSLMAEIGSEIIANRWMRFLSSLQLNLQEAASMSQSSEIPSLYRSEILAALKKWPDNNVISVLSNGDLIIDGGQKVPWTDL